MSFFEGMTSFCTARGQLQPQQTRCIWGFPKIRGTILGVPIIRTMVFGDLYWGPLLTGNYHFRRNITYWCLVGNKGIQPLSSPYIMHSLIPHQPPVSIEFS